jgi:hypothetical protein
MNNPDHISEGLETSFWVKILKFFDADPGLLGLLGEEFSIGPLGPLRECR